MSEQALYADWPDITLTDREKVIEEHLVRWELEEPRPAYLKARELSEALKRADNDALH